MYAHAHPHAHAQTHARTRARTHTNRNKKTKKMVKWECSNCLLRVIMLWVHSQIAILALKNKGNCFCHAQSMSLYASVWTWLKDGGGCFLFLIGMTTSAVYILIFI